MIKTLGSAIRGNGAVSVAERVLRASAFFVIVAAIALALPSLMVSLGLPPEGDAVDYRIPLVRWILRHQALPNWSWSVVDDYPNLGELLMLPFYWLYPSLARLVPIAGYVGLGLSGGLILASWNSHLPLRQSTLVALGAAWALALRPVAIQSNLLMIDNLASAFLLGSLALLLRKSIKLSALLAAAAMATRYTTWVSAGFIAILCFWYSTPLERKKNFITFCLIASLGPLPFMIRNFLLNHAHPFFPLDSPSALAIVPYGNYGRGKGLLDFLLLPWDLLVTNTFVTGFFDYTVGKLFYLQLGAVVCFGRRYWPAARSRKVFFYSLAFAGAHLVAWFFTSQQLRFLVPTLVIFGIWMLSMLLEARAFLLVAALSFMGFFSVLSVQKDSIRMAFFDYPVTFASSFQNARACFVRANIDSEPLGLVQRDGILGFFDMDFFFLLGHPYGIPSEEIISPRWIYSLEPRAGYEPWPKSDPCLLRKTNGQ